MALAGQWQRLFLFLAVSICRCQRRGALAVAALQGSDTHRRGARCEANLAPGFYHGRLPFFANAAEAAASSSDFHLARSFWPSASGSFHPVLRECVRPVIRSEKPS